MGYGSRYRSWDGTVPNMAALHVRAALAGAQLLHSLRREALLTLLHSPLRTLLHSPPKKKGPIARALLQTATCLASCDARGHSHALSLRILA